MDMEILGLRQKKFTVEQIAEKLGVTVGQVKYRLYKKITLDESSLNKAPHSPDRDRESSPAMSIGESMFVPSPPQYYGENDIVIVVQGPTALYVYWEITWPLRQMISDFCSITFDYLPKRMRIYDVTDIWFNGSNAHWFRDIPIDEQADNWFIYDLEPDRTYIIDLGVISQERFVPFLRSKPKSTPRSQPVFPRTEVYPVTSSYLQERVKPQWFENFRTYTMY